MTKSLTKSLLPYIQLARLNRPIGTWLLLWPCCWSAIAAWPYSPADTEILYVLALFAAGALLMRGAGCTYNDLADHEFDKQVARTKTRPLPSGQISRNAAWMFFFIQLAGGALVLLQFNLLTIMLGVASLALIAIYPFMKRITSWPQFFLGLAFSWGALMGWAEVANQLPLSAYCLYAGSIFWVIGYDTIYALQDKEDDALLGLKSTALVLYDRIKLSLGIFYGAAWTLMILSGIALDASIGFYGAMAAAGAHLIWQVVALNPDDPQQAGKIFHANRDCGAIIFAAFAANSVIKMIS